MRKNKELMKRLIMASIFTAGLGIARAQFVNPLKGVVSAPVSFEIQIPAVVIPTGNTTLTDLAAALTAKGMTVVSVDKSKNLINIVQKKTGGLDTEGTWWQTQ